MDKMKIIFIVILGIAILLVSLKIFFKSDNKNNITGNNKNIKEIEEYFLNISSYKAKLDINIKSNKNENNYKIYQEVKGVDYCYQRLDEPENVKGMEFIYQNGSLEIKNTEISASKIYQNYPYITNNYLFITDFFDKYRNSNQKEIKEQNDKIIMQCENTEKTNKYNAKQILTINKDELKPEKLEIIDVNNNCRVYILYNEIEFNI